MNGPQVETKIVSEEVNLARLFRGWKRAAGPAFGRFIPAAPFSALATFGLPPRQPLFYDEICQQIAATLVQTLEGEAVRAGEAAFVIDLPGPISLGLGFHLQQAGMGIAPVLLFAGLWRPGAVIEGGESASALIEYSQKLAKRTEAANGYAFLLEQERTTEIEPWQLVTTFDNRYRAGIALFPPIPDLLNAGIMALIDLRRAGNTLPDDLAEFYELASRAGLDIFQTVIK